ncbi:MAG: peptidase [Phycisphaerales bacterium]|nr:peptidase [Phycisphaerales bacterium]
MARFALFTLTDQAEQDDTCAGIYNKSLLYLVSNAFEEKERIPLFRDGWPILGMERFVRRDAELMDLWQKGKAEWVLSPNNEPVGSVDASRSTSHGGFDDDEATLKATFARIAGQRVDKAELAVQASARLLSGRRLGLEMFRTPPAAAATNVSTQGGEDSVKPPGRPKRKRSKSKV